MTSTNQPQKKEVIVYVILLVLSLVAFFFIGQLIQNHKEVIEGNMFYLIPFTIFVAGLFAGMLIRGIYLLVFLCF